MFYRLSLSFIALHRFISVIKQFSGLFSYTLAYIDLIDLIFGMEINFYVLQIEFEFHYTPSIFGEITGLET